MKRYLQKIGLLLGLLMVTVTGWGVAPKVMTYDPALGATGVAVDKSIVITFDQAILYDQEEYEIVVNGDVYTIYFGVPAQTNPGIVSIPDNGNTLTINPGLDFLYSTAYNVVIPDGLIVNSLGEAAGLINLNFTTTAEVPLTAPIVSSLSPTNGFQSVGINDNILISFDQLIKFVNSTSTSYIRVYKKDVIAPVVSVKLVNGILTSSNGGCSISNKTLTITHNSTFEYGTEYYVKFSTTNIIQSIDNSLIFTGLTGTTDYTFKTVGAPVPSLSNPPLSPADNSTDVAITSDLAITFTSNIRFNSTATSHSIKLYQAGNSTPVETINCVSGSATYSSGTAVISAATLTINPTADLTPGASYYVTIDAGAIETTIGGVYPGFTDATTWNFSTYIQVAYMSGYPKIQNISATTVDAYSSLNKKGSTVCVVVPATDATPSITQVMNGEDAAGNTVPAAHFGSFPIPSAGVVRSDVLSSLNENTSYKVCFVSIDGSGNYLETVSPTVVTFSTIDTSGPTLTFDPVDSNESVPIEQIVTITFNEAIRNIDDSEITNDNVSNLIMFTVGGVEVPRTVTFDNVTRKITIHTTSLLEAGMMYYLTVQSVEDFNGNATGSNTIYFKTKDTTAPYIKTSIPANGAKNVSLYEPVVITFNEPILNFDGSEVTSASISTILSISPAVSYSASISADKLIVTLTPNEYAMTTLYSVTLNGNTIKDKSGNVTTASSSFSFTTETCNIWNGSTNSDMKDGNNWTGTYVAGKSIVVEKGLFPMVMSDSYYLPNLIIKAGADVKVGSGYTVDLTGDLRVYSSNTESIGNGSILIDGTLNVDSENVYFYQNVSTTDYTYHISSPVEGVTQTSMGSDLLKQKQVSPTYSWVNVGSDVALIAGKGYASRNRAAGVWKFCGAINNNSSYTFNALRTSVNYGWNLAGNPYPCSINWDNVILTNVKPTFYMWRNDRHAYGTYNRTDGGVAVNMDAAPRACVIPSMHAFFIQVEDNLTDGSITIPSSVRELNEYTYMKSADVSTSSIVRLTGNVGTSVYKDEMLVRFASGALKDEVSDDYDSPKQLNGASDILDLYVVENSNQYVISSFGLNYINDLVVQLGFNHNSKATEICTIELSSLENVGDDIMIYLEDISKPELGMIDFRSNPTYSFEVTGVVTNTTRFKLHFVGNADSKETVTSIEEIDKSGSCVVYSIDNTVFVKVTDIDQATCQIVDVNGKVLMLEQVNTSGLNRYTVEKSGVYLVKIVSENNVWNQKVLINK